MSLDNLIGFGSDDCSTMLGSRGGVAVKLKQSSPSLVAFHYLAHRLQLAILDIAEQVLFRMVFNLIIGCLSTEY